MVNMVSHWPVNSVDYFKMENRVTLILNNGLWTA